MRKRKAYNYLIISVIIISFIYMNFVLSSNKEPINIGLMVSLTGTYPDLGREIRDGALLAVEIINEEGGINGRPVELIVKDNQFDLETAKNNYIEFSKEDVIAVIGPATSSAALNLLPTINEKKLTVIAPTPTSTKLKGLDDFMIRMRPTNQDEAEVVSRFIERNLKINKFAVVYDVNNPAYSLDLVENLQYFLPAKVKIVEYPLNGKDINFKVLAINILNKKPDMVFIILDVYKTSLLIQNLRILRPDLPIFISIWGKSPKIIELGGKWSEGIYTVDNIEFPLRGRNGETVFERFKRRFGREMDFASVNGFDSVMIIKKAIENGANKNNIRDVILEIRKFEGIQGHIIFDKFGDRLEKPFLLKVENGRFKRVD